MQLWEITWIDNPTFMGENEVKKRLAEGFEPFSISNPRDGIPERLWMKRPHNWQDQIHYG